MSHPSRSRTRGWYPFWLGLLALGLVTWAWLAHDVPTPATTDAAPPVAAADAGAELPPEKPTEAELAWRIEGRGPIEPAVFESCLRAAGQEHLTPLGDGRGGLILTAAGRPRPQMIVPFADGLWLRTPVEGAPYAAAGLHVLAAYCLYTEGAAVVDPLLGRRFSGDGWPRLGPRGGPPIDALVAFDKLPGEYRTTGLVRLERGELAIIVGEADGVAAMHLLALAAAAAVAAPADAETLTLPGDTVTRLVPQVEAIAAGWAQGHTQAGLKVLADANGKAPLPLPRAAPPRPSPEHPSPRPRRARAPARKPAKPSFRPDYR